jgi:hypothetical protein
MKVKIKYQHLLMPVHPAIAMRASNSKIRKYLQRKAFRMKPATIIGFLLILLGIVGFALGGISFTHEKKDVDLGPLQVSHQQKRTIPISPVLSTIALVAGVGLVVVGAKAR